MITTIKSRNRVYQILNKSQGNDRLSFYCDIIIFLIIVINVICVCLESVEEINNKYSILFSYIEIFSISFFSVEYLLRIWSAASQKDDACSSSEKRFRYIFSFTGLIDIIAIAPSIIQLFGFGIDTRWIRIIRLARLLKISHYSSALEDLISAVYNERNAFGATLYILVISLFLSSSIMYIIENDNQPEAFSSIPSTMWWSIITLTTVGYGDTIPMTSLGKVIGAITALMGVCTVALLTGIVASAFSNQIKVRKNELGDEIEKALADGILDEDEIEKLERLRKRYNIPESELKHMIKEFKN